jgi:hypothetical protein
MQSTAETVLIAVAWGAAGMFGWIITHFVASPILKIREIRLDAMQVAERYAYVLYGADWNAVSRANDALPEVATELRAQVRGYSWSVRKYCGVMGYDLETASSALLGLAQMAGENVGMETRKNILNLTYKALNACGHISKDDMLKLEAAISDWELHNSSAKS